jgi:hypothetical protein
MSHLHLVTDAPPPPRRRGGPSPAFSLSDEEVQHLRAAIRGLARTRYASLAALARALRVAPAVLCRRKRQSPGLAVALWRLTGIPVEVLLSGKLAVVPATLAAAPPERDPA